MSDKSLVYLAQTSGRAGEEELATAARRAFEAADLGSRVRGLTAIKSHFGERGGRGFVPPRAIREVVDLVRAAGGTPFLTDTTALYPGQRSTAVGYAALVLENGFTPEAVGAPFLCADGLVGASEIEVPIDGKHHSSVALAADALRANSAIVVSHVTGHLMAGLGATIKNIGMGFASRRGKLRQHSRLRPQVSADRCVGCQDCIPNCPGEAIRPQTGQKSGSPVMVIDVYSCIGCGECLISCRQGAVEFDWNVGSRRLQEAIAEYALGWVRRMAGRFGCLTFVVHITKNCDCLSQRETPLCPDIGVLAGTDPVALDQAAHDLIRIRNGRTLEAMSFPQLDGTLQLAHGERIGLGSRRYELVEVP